MHQMELNLADVRTPRVSIIADIMTSMVSAMGFSLDSFVERAMETYRWEQDMRDMLLRDARRQQIRKFNKRKAQRRAYTGRKRK